MSFLSAHHFIAARGLDSFLRFLELCRDHHSVASIGAAYSFSASMAARYRKRFFVVEYRLRPAVIEAIEFHLSVSDSSREEFTGRLAKLRSDAGGFRGPRLLV